MHIIGLSLLTTAHWIFAVEYFELAIKFEMVLGHVKSNFEAQFKRKNKIVLVANLTFYLFITGLAAVWFYFRIRTKITLYIIFYNVEAICIIFTAFILIYSIVTLHREIKKNT